MITSTRYISNLTFIGWCLELVLIQQFTDITGIWLCSFVASSNCRRRRYRVASGGRSVAPRWSRLVARLHRSAGGRGIPLSFRTWSIHLSRGRPGRRFHWSLGGRPRDRSTWQWRALCAGTSCCSLATWPKRALRRWLMTSKIDGKPVVAAPSSFRMNCCQLICSSCL